MNPERGQHGPLRKLRDAAYDERSRYGALNSVKPLKSLHTTHRTVPTLTLQHAEHIVQPDLASTTGRIAHSSTQQTLLALREVHWTHLCGLSTGGAIGLADAPPPWMEQNNRTKFERDRSFRG